MKPTGMGEAIDVRSHVYNQIAMTHSQDSHDCQPEWEKRWRLAISDIPKPFYGKGITEETIVANVALLIEEAEQRGADAAVEYIKGNVAHFLYGKDGGYWVVKPSVIEEARQAWKLNK